jgi:transposase
MSRLLQFNVPLHERSIGKLVHRLGFRHISVRPRHPQADASAQEAHKNVWPAPSASSFGDLI